MFKIKKIIKNNSIILFLFLTLNGFSQQPIISGITSSGQDSTKDIILSSGTLGISLSEYHEKERTVFISKMADSLNNSEANKLPFWLSQCDFDYFYSELWKNSHNPTCLRQLIFARITNKKSLRAIIKSKNKDYSTTSKRSFNLYGEHKIPFQDESNVSLAKQQLKILRVNN
jgi:hypothetical protein